MLLRGRTIFDPCLGDANTHASHMCQSLDGGTFPKRCTKTLAVAREKFIISISRTHTKKLRLL